MPFLVFCFSRGTVWGYTHTRAAHAWRRGGEGVRVGRRSEEKHRGPSEDTEGSGRGWKGKGMREPRGEAHADAERAQPQGTRAGLRTLACPMSSFSLSKVKVVYEKKRARGARAAPG